VIDNNVIRREYWEIREDDATKTLEVSVLTGGLVVFSYQAVSHLLERCEFTKVRAEYMR